METVKINVGDICRVINVGDIYTEYDEFAINAGHEDIVTNEYVAGNCQLMQGKEVRVLYNKPDEGVSCSSLAIVETINGPNYYKFMIGDKGLRPLYTAKAKAKHRQTLILKEYLAGKILKEPIPDEDVTKFLVDAIVFKNPMDIQFICEALITDKDYENVLLKDGGLLGVVPESRRSLELCQIAVNEEAYAINFVPENLKSLV